MDIVPPDPSVGQSDPDVLTVHADDLAALGLTPAEVAVVMRGADVISQQEADDRLELLRRETEGHR